MKNLQKQAVLSLSGGLDSSTLLLRLLSEGYQVTALSFDYGQKHKVELERAQELVNYINTNPNRFGHADRAPGGFFEIYPQVRYQVIKLDGLSTLLNSSLVEGGKDVPEGHYENENMKETVVPNRNKIFSSIIQAVALSIYKDTGEKVYISLGIHAGDHAIYPDCRQEFRDIDHQAFIAGNWDAENVEFYTPYLDKDKFGILVDGLECCSTLRLDFDEVYRRTNTSYKPIFIENEHYDPTTFEKVSNKWYPDYKSASSVERVEAFIKLGRPDPVTYANEFGTVDWDTVRKYVLDLLFKHSKN